MFTLKIEYKNDGISSSTSVEHKKLLPSAEDKKRNLKRFVKSSELSQSVN